MKKVFDRIRKYNCWDGQAFKTDFVRQEYLDRIVKYLDNKLIKVLVGQRRVGKSYILRQIMNYLVEQKQVSPLNIFYLNKEYVVFEDIKTAKDLVKLFEYYQKKLKVKGKVYIFLDEVQNIEGWEIFVNSYSQDFTNEYEVFVTGSNSTLLSGELATLLSGRYVEFEIFPFSLFEYISFNNLPISRENFLTYLQTGGLPEMFGLQQEDMQRHYIESLKDTIIVRDIVRRNTIKDVSLLEDVFAFLMTNVGSLTSFASIVKYFKSKQKKTNYETLSAYVGYLCNTFVVHAVDRYNIKGKQLLGGERKFYMNDLAFKNYLMGYYPTDIGNHLENYVYLQLRRLGGKISVGVTADKEIDFVVENQGQTMYVQVAYLLSNEETIKREFGNLLSIKDNHKKIVISLDGMKFNDYKGVVQLSPWELK